MHETVSMDNAEVQKAWAEYQQWCAAIVRIHNGIKK